MGVQKKATSFSTGTVTIDKSGEIGYLEIKKSVFFPPSNGTEINENIVQSWIGLKGVNGDGVDVFAFASGRFSIADPKNPEPGAVAVVKACGNPKTLAVPGYKSVSSTMDTWSCFIKLLENDLSE